jgi:hypothetical protein
MLKRLGSMYTGSIPRGEQPVRQLAEAEPASLARDPSGKRVESVEKPF